MFKWTKLGQDIKTDAKKTEPYSMKNVLTALAKKINLGMWNDLSTIHRHINLLFPSDYFYLWKKEVESAYWEEKDNGYSYFNGKDFRVVAKPGADGSEGLFNRTTMSYLSITPLF